MDNQPTQIDQPQTELPQPEQPISAVPPEPPQTSDTGDIILEAGHRKRKKALIATIISIIAVLLIGGGAFAVAYFISNQPNNIAMSALNNLMNAKKVEVAGSINLSMNGTFLAFSPGLDSLNIPLDEKTADSNNSTTASISATLTDGTKIAPVELGEVMLNDGVLYIEATGVKDLYYNNLYDLVNSAVISQVQSNYTSQLVEQCYAASPGNADCAALYNSELPAELSANVEYVANNILQQIGGIIESIDGQWVEISIDDIMNDEMLSTIDQSSRQQITSTYHCTIDTINSLSNYSSEFSDLYGQNPFLNMTPAANSYYDLSLDATNLANYMNAVPNTNFYKDLAKCTGDSTSAPTITADDIQPALTYLPQISAKFDGIFDHHLTDLKITSSNDYFNLSSDLQFTYPNDITVAAPSNSRPAMEIFTEVYQNLTGIQPVAEQQPATAEQ